MAVVHTEGTNDRLVVGAGTWAGIERGWRARDARRFRWTIERLLGDAPIATWRALSKALFEGGDDLAERELGEQGIDEAVAALFAAAARRPPGQRPQAAAMVAAFVLQELLVFWERLTEYGAIGRIVEVFDGRAAAASGDLDEAPRDLTAPVELFDQCRALIDACRSLALALAPQMRTEQAMVSVCHHTFVASADDARRALAESCGHLSELAAGAARCRDVLGVDLTDLDDLVLRLSELVRDEGVHTHGYFELLADHVGPAMAGYDALLSGEGDRPRVLDRLTEATSGAEEFAADEANRALVFGSEARAHRRVVARMAKLVEAGNASFQVVDGQITYVFPFGIDEVGHGRRLVELLEEQRAEGQLPPVVGVPIELDDTPTTDIWGSTAADGRAGTSARLLFEDHELVLVTLGGECWVDLDVEVRLNEFGNHYVRVAISTETPREGGDGDLGVEAWTPRHIDQWLRRVSGDLDRDDVHFRHRERRTERTGGWCSLMELAEAVVDDLVEILFASARGDGATGERVHDLHGAAPAEERDAVHGELIQTNAHAVLTFVRVVETHDGRPGRVITDARELADLPGCGAIWSPVRTFPSCLDEWLVLGGVPGENLLAGEGDAGWLSSGEGVTVMVLPTAPHWQILEFWDVVEFTVSLPGAYHSWTRWLRRISELTRRLADQAVVEGRLVDLQGRIIDSVDRQSQIRSMLDHVRSAQLARSPRDRMLLSRLRSANGLVELEEALDLSLTAESTQQDVASAHVARMVAERERQREQQQAARQRIVEFVLAVLTVFGVAEFFGWLNDDLGWQGAYVLPKVAVLLLVGGAVVYLARRGYLEDEEGH